MHAWNVGFVAFVMVSVGLAGCLETELDNQDAMDRFAFTSPDNPIPEEGLTHNHQDPAQHRFARNASVVFHDDLLRFGGNVEQPVGAHAAAIHEGRALLALAVHGAETGGGQQGVHVYDISTPHAPVHLSFFNSGVQVNGDRTVAWSESGETLFLGYEAGDLPGVAAVDVRNPSSPLLAGFWSDPLGFGSHTIAAGAMDGTQYVFSLSMGVTILSYADGVFSVEGKYVTQDQLAIADAAQYAANDNAGGAGTFALRSVYGHDMNFYLDPLTGMPLLLVAYAYDGAKILDVSTPAAPVLMGRFMPPADTDHKHYTHSITAERGPDGALVVVVGSETFEPENQQVASPIWILDATDTVTGLPMQNQPIHLSTWRNPGGAAAGDLGLSVHFFRQEAGLLYLSHYHGGVWAVDLQTESARVHPEAFGYLMPVPDDAMWAPEECCIGFDLDGVPMTFDVTVLNGTVYAADLIQGLVVGEFQRPASAI